MARRICIATVMTAASVAYAPTSRSATHVATYTPVADARTESAELLQSRERRSDRGARGPATSLAPPVSRSRSVSDTRRSPVAFTAPTVTPAGNCVGKMSSAKAHACWDGLINQYAWPHATAFAVMMCESTGSPTAANDGSTARGLFQVLGGSYDAATNVRQAFGMYSSRGWQPWDSSRRCWA